MKQQLIDVIAGMGHEAYRMVTMQQMVKIAGLPQDTDITKELDLLSKGGDAVLERWAMISDDLGEHTLEDEDLAHFDKTGEVVHPETGDLIAAGQVDISIFYAVTSPTPETSEVRYGT